MKRVIMSAAVLITFAMLFAACGGSSSSSTNIAFAKGCKAATPNKVSGRTIVKVGGTSCVVIDHKAIAVASGHSWVAAHGDSVVDASGHATVVIFNDAVKCDIRGADVTVVNAIEGQLGEGGFLDPSCETLTTYP